MDINDFRRVRHLPDYDVTPEWVLHHLAQHEAEHRSEIGALRARAEQPDYQQRQDYRADEQVPLLLDGQELAHIAVRDVLP